MELPESMKHLVNKGSTANPVVMSAVEIREQIFTLAEEYFYRVHSAQPFVPGKSFIPASAKNIFPADLKNIIDSALEMWLTSGRFTKKFERSLANFLGTPVSALFVNSGSSANLLAISSLGSPLLKKLDIKPLESGDEVITVAAAFPTTVNPILQNGWTPVFIDVDFATLNALPESIMDAVGPRTRAVVLSHTLGNPFAADVIAEFCKKNGLLFVEDCCDALGARVGSKMQLVGTYGNYSTLSFYPAHHITTGEGGAVFASTQAFRKISESLRNWGRDCWCDTGQDNSCGRRFEWNFDELPLGYDHKYTYSSIGYNFKATDLQAAIGLSQLSHLEDFIAKRNDNWKKLFNLVSQSKVLKDKLKPVISSTNSQPSWFGFAMHCEKGISRGKIISKLEDKKIGTRMVYAGNILRHPGYKNISCRIHGQLTNTDEIMQRTFWIGVHPQIDDRHLFYMIETLEAVIRAYA